jgi:hypothetical protein
MPFYSIYGVVSQGFSYRVIKSENGQFIAYYRLELCPFQLQITHQMSQSYYLGVFRFLTGALLAKY